MLGCESDGKSTDEFYGAWGTGCAGGLWICDEVILGRESLFYIVFTAVCASGVLVYIGKHGKKRSHATFQLRF